MAKRKKSKSKKASNPDRPTGLGPSSPFLRQAFAVLLIVLSLFTLLGGFGWGGKLPEALFDGASWLIGYVAYVLPAVIVYMALLKLRHEENIVPFSKLVAGLGALVSLSALLHSFVPKAESAIKANDGAYGGQMGKLFVDLVSGMLSTATSMVLFIVLALLGVLFLIELKPQTLLEKIKQRRQAEDVEGDDTKATSLKDIKQAATSFRLHKGVPTESSDDPQPESKPGPRRSTFKNSAEPVDVETVSQEALTVDEDPDWEFPSADLLNPQQDKADPGNVQDNAEAIRDTLANFNIDVEMEGANIGPRVTQYTLKPPSGIKLTKITGLESNIALDLAAQSIRIEAPIPGKRAVGIEVPNVKPATVRLRGVLTSKEWKTLPQGGLHFAVGRDIGGVPEVGRLESMPHLLIAGQTGSGKSVMINTLLISLLYRNSPSQLKLILVDPKQVELTPYNDIPHLLTPVIHEPEKCISALKWAVAEMDRRLRTFAEVGKRSITEYNAQKNETPMPYIVIVIDELADLMMVSARDVESLIVRLAQKARAAGIHLVLATQRPSVDVITGLIKANVPARIAFTVASQVDSRTILDGAGAEKLLGYGDMLYLTSSMPKPKRLQGALIEEGEIQKVCDSLRMQRPPQYDDEVVSQPVQINGRGGMVAAMDSAADSDDDLWRDAITVVVEHGKASTSMLQRRLRIGYSRAARLIENMEEQGIIGQADGSRPREVLITSVDQAFGGGEDEVADLEDDYQQDQA